MELLTVPIDSLVPDPENAREHPAENIAAIRQSLERFGQATPLVVHNATSMVVSGNGTVQAMRQLGWNECRIVLYEGTIEEARALAIALNRTAELATWDYKILTEQLRTLRDGTPDLVVGFDTTELDMLLSAEWKPETLIPVEGHTRTQHDDSKPKDRELIIEAAHVPEVLAAVQAEQQRDPCSESAALVRIIRRAAA